MGFSDSLKDAMDVNRKIEIAEAMEIEALFEKLNANAEVAAFKPELKKGLFGKNIVFPEVARVTVKAAVKGNVVTLTKTTAQAARVSVGGVGIPVGGNKVEEGSEYFKSVCAAVENALK